ncbi:MAG TPA: lytic transglycosylase domain-containing protein [Blastocatellia bacterium]
MRTLGKILWLIVVVAATAVCAAAQGPLSPPDRPPVPLSDVDQNRSREDALQRQAAGLEHKTAAESSVDHAGEVRIPFGVLAHKISTGNPALDALILEAASRYNLDPYLILSVMNQESGYNPSAVSPKGASGLMQLMPETAVRFGVRNIFDPRENVMAGASYLRWLLDRFGDVRLALAGYNAGEGAVESYGNRIPPFQETQNYVQIIYTRYTRLRGTMGGPSILAPDPQAAASAEPPPSYNQIVPPSTSSLTASDSAGRKP